MQNRKETEIPYIGHLLGVASIVIDAGGAEEEAIAALLHDAPEDQGGKARLADIEERFGSRVAAIIERCSDPLHDTGKTKEPWDLRKQKYLEHLRGCNDASVYLVSAADKLHNARATLADFHALGSDVWGRFKVGREAQLRNYRNLIELYKTRLDDKRLCRVARELEAVIGELETKSSSPAPAGSDSAVNC